MATALDTIKRAMRICGVIGQNETPSSSEAQDGLTALNSMLALWYVDKAFAYSITQANFPLTSGVNTYTIGTGATFNVTRPVKIDNAFIRINSVDYPLKSINNQDYDSIAYKANQNIPEYFYYNSDFPQGTIYLYGTPTQGQIYLDMWTQLTQFTDLTTNISYPPGYDVAIAYNLAKFIAPEYGVGLTPEAIVLAAETLGMVKSRNLPSPVMKTEVGVLAGNGGYGWSRGY